jgi:hypothetical protein
VLGCIGGSNTTEGHESGHLIKRCTYLWRGSLMAWQYAGVKRREEVKALEEV